MIIYVYEVKKYVDLAGRGRERETGKNSDRTLGE